MKSLNNYISEGFFQNIGNNFDGINEFMNKLIADEGNEEQWHFDINKETYTVIITSSRPQNKFEFKLNILENWEYFKKLFEKEDYNGHYKIYLRTKYNQPKESWRWMRRMYNDGIHDLLLTVSFNGYYANGITYAVLGDKKNFKVHKIRLVEHL